MPNTKKKSRTVKLELPEEMFELCDLVEVRPETMLTAFMNDLLRLPASNGSDERNFAGAYFMRMVGHYMDRYRELEDFLAVDRRY